MKILKMNGYEEEKKNIISRLETSFRVRVLQVEISPYFGNFMLIIETERSIFRFVRDRGYNNCEISQNKDFLHWTDDTSIGIPDDLKRDDFFKYVEYILESKQLRKC